MKNPIIKITLVGLMMLAIYAASLAMFTAALGIAVAFLFSHTAGIGTRLTMFVVGALAGGLGGEIAQTIYLHSTSTGLANAGLYLDAILISLVCAAGIWVAVFCEYLWRRFVSKGA